jgi:hypothetical protein
LDNQGTANAQHETGMTDSQVRKLLGQHQGNVTKATTWLMTQGIDVTRELGDQIHKVHSQMLAKS